ncbi:SH3 domain-containing protein [Butyrivibrio sp. FCS014]|uniref:SH3 domain-containing protein n=1 Tax=Butyrivibrio sp. FCS014 TaxID=1408304 RepID=UPI000467B06B|nr:SH3 domain-containing protein [Butyrivibrio sp. FCS014]
MRNNKKDNKSWRNNTNSFSAFLGDNKKYLMPAVLVVAVVLTVVIAINANKRATEVAQVNTAATEASVIEIPDVTMEENAYPEVNALVERYYTASAAGDSDTLSEIYRGLEETEILKAVAASEYIDKFENITVYTKPGPREGCYVAYVYNEVKLFDYDGTVPGLETLYICTDDDGTLYINGDIADAAEIDYIKQISVQADVIDLNNRIATRYNEMVSADENLAELLTRMRSGIQVAVGEGLATAEASTPDESASEATTEEQPGTVTVTKRVIKALDVVNIRSSDSVTADTLDKTTQGQEFKELERLDNGWSKVEYKNGVAYVKTEFFETVSEETEVIPVENNEEQDDASEDSDEQEETQADNAAAEATTSQQETTTDSKVKSDAKTGKLVVTQSVKLRKGQGTDTDSLGTIYAGSTVNVVEQYSNGWAKVEYNKNTGYIKSEFLRQ